MSDVAENVPGRSTIHCLPVCARIISTGGAALLNDGHRNLNVDLFLSVYHTQSTRLIMRCISANMNNSIFIVARVLNLIRWYRYATQRCHSNVERSQSCQRFIRSSVCLRSKLPIACHTI